MDHQPVRSSPAPARVQGNRWTDVQVPALGAWTPREPLSVVIPHYQSPAALGLVVEALAGQTYPAHLVQVLVVDDGSDRPPPVGGDVRIDVQVLVQERRGFGAARARNLGAARAEGSILVFLDADMVPERGLLEAHARWHHAVADAVTVGFRTHVPVNGVAPSQVRRAMARGSLGVLWDGHAQQVPEYVEFHMQRTRDLTSDDDDLFRTVTSGNLGLRRDTFRAVGGYDASFAQWGGEDTEFGYRLFNHGCLLVPERAAWCWHQGMPGYEVQAKQRSLYEQRAKIAHLIPHPGFRRSLPGRSFAVPRLVVTVRVEAQPAADVTATVESVLACTFHDLVVCLDVPATHPDQRWLERQFGQDPRVLVGEDLDPLQRFPASPLHLELPPAVILGAESLGGIVQRLEGAGRPIGLLHLTLPGTSPRERLAKAFRTRAFTRASRLADTDLEPLVGELFGEEWAPGGRYGFQPLHQGAPAPAIPAPAVPLMPAEASSDLAAVAQFVRALDPARRARLLRLARRVIRLVRAVQSARRRL